MDNPQLSIMHLHPSLLVLVAMLVFMSCNTSNIKEEVDSKIAIDVDDNLLVNADSLPGEWLSYGKNYAEDRYSSLEQINKTTISQLGLAWSLDLGTDKGIEATPVVVDGVMFLTGPWSIVYALNAVTGRLIWKYDPGVAGHFMQRSCCDVVNRGVAVYKGKIYVGTLDGRLVALDATTGKSLWDVLTVDTTKPYTITGAPRVVKGKVIIGNGGAELGVRGYISAYDPENGELIWRFYTVPGDPSKGFESPELENAAQTWTGDWWKYGGGGTAWDAMAFDPDLNLLYVGTGNGSPWSRQYRSPGGGDNLFLSCILAINPDDGKLIWYYQTTPGDTWDYTATQHLILADLTINGSRKKVIMQAPKNGFFYVLDRTNGHLISAKPYTFVNWATGVDTITGRPIEQDYARFTDLNAEIYPNALGGHNWQPMAYNKKTKLVYFPARNAGMVYGHDKQWKYNKPADGFGSGIGWNTALGKNTTKTFRMEKSAPKVSERLLAWDPVQQKVAWSYEHNGLWNAGVLTTASGLVFEGTSDGRLLAFDAVSGSILWQKDLGTGIIASPVSYSVGDTQYISIAAGWGGSMGKSVKYTKNINSGTVYTFALNKNKSMPVYAANPKKTLINVDFVSTEREVNIGATLYNQYCETCHGNVGAGGGNIPDLGFSSTETFEVFSDILLKGLLSKRGMPNFSDRLTTTDVQNIKYYIFSSAKKVAKGVNAGN